MSNAVESSFRGDRLCYFCEEREAVTIRDRPDGALPNCPACLDCADRIDEQDYNDASIEAYEARA